MGCIDGLSQYSPRVISHRFSSAYICVTSVLILVKKVLVLLREFRGRSCAPWCIAWEKKAHSDSIHFVIADSTDIPRIRADILL